MTILKQKDKRKGLPQHKRYPKIKEVILEKEMTTKNYIEKLKDLEEEPVGTPVPNLPENEVIVVTRSPISRYETQVTLRFPKPCYRSQAT